MSASEYEFIESMNDYEWKIVCNKDRKYKITCYYLIEGDADPNGEIIFQFDMNAKTYTANGDVGQLDMSNDDYYQININIKDDRVISCRKVRTN